MGMEFIFGISFGMLVGTGIGYFLGRRLIDLIKIKYEVD
jgi:membrane protein DedA with SNARE-associated domain